MGIFFPRVVLMNAQIVKRRYVIEFQRYFLVGIFFIRVVLIKAFVTVYSVLCAVQIKGVKSCNSLKEYLMMTG